MWTDLLTALALVLVLEGILPFVNPRGLRQALIVLAQMDDRTIRLAGLVSMMLGVVVLYLVR